MIRYILCKISRPLRVATLFPTIARTATSEQLSFYSYREQSRTAFHAWTIFFDRQHHTAGSLSKMKHYFRKKYWTLPTRSRNIYIPGEERFEFRDVAECGTRASSTQQSSVWSDGANYRLADFISSNTYTWRLKMFSLWIRSWSHFHLRPDCTISVQSDLNFVLELIHIRKDEGCRQT